MTRRGDAGEEQAFKAVQVSSGYNRLGNMVAYRCYLLQPFRPAYLCRHDKQHVLGIVMWRCCKIFTHGLPVPHFTRWHACLYIQYFPRVAQKRVR